MGMKIEFGDADCDRLETDPKFNAGFANHIVRAYRKVMQVIRDAADERDLYALRGLRFKALDGARAHQHSIRLNDQWRLIVELRGKGADKVVYVVGIEDYH
jgi:proteic killer suppression protein